jgi:hypothetical protein
LTVMTSTRSLLRSMPPEPREEPRFHSALLIEGVVGRRDSAETYEQVALAFGRQQQDTFGVRDLANAAPRGPISPRAVRHVLREGRFNDNVAAALTKLIPPADVIALRVSQHHTGSRRGPREALALELVSPDGRVLVDAIRVRRGLRGWGAKQLIDKYFKACPGSGRRAPVVVLDRTLGEDPAFRNALAQLDVDYVVEVEKRYLYENLARDVYEQRGLTDLYEQDPLVAQNGDLPLARPLKAGYGPPGELATVLHDPEGDADRGFIARPARPDDDVVSAYEVGRRVFELAQKARRLPRRPLSENFRIADFIAPDDPWVSGVRIRSLYAGYRSGLFPGPNPGP